jgi:hypothetical protein
MEGNVRVRQRSRAVDLKSDQQEPVNRREDGHVLVTKVVYGVETVVADEAIAVPAFHTPVARVRVGGSLTRNLGDYNSARVEASVELPCYPTKDEVERVYGICSEMVDDFIRREMQAVTG